MDGDLVYLFDSFKPGARDANRGRWDLGVTQRTISKGQPEHGGSEKQCCRDVTVRCDVTHHVGSIYKCCAVASAAQDLSLEDLSVVTGGQRV